VALIDALRAVCAFDPPPSLPPCDLEELALVLDAHGLAPLASYQLENHRLGASVPRSLRERLLAVYQGVVNDNVFKLVTLKGALRAVKVPVILLGGAAYVDWLYPHLAFRPVGDLRLMVKGSDGGRFVSALGESGFESVKQGPGGHTATLDDGRLTLRIQEGLVEGRALDHGAFERCEAFPAMGPSAYRPGAEDALLLTVADLALAGLHGPLLLVLDLREILGLSAFDDPGRREAVRARALEAGLGRALYGAAELVAHYFPETAVRARALAPELGRALRLAVDAVVESARDPARLRLARGAQTASELLVAP
jgi:hypothetical protein